MLTINIEMFKKCCRSNENGSTKNEYNSVLLYILRRKQLCQERMKDLRKYIHREQ